MNFKKAYRMLSLLIILFISVFIIEPSCQSGFVGAYYEVLPELKEFGPAPCEGQEFSIAVWLKNVTTQTVPKGVFGVEIQLQWNKTYIELKSRTLKLGVSGGVLNSPYFTAKDELTTTVVANDTYWISATSLPPAQPWFGEGIVAEFTFRIIKQPKELLGETDVTTKLALIFTDLVDSEAKPVFDHGRKDGDVILHAMPSIVVSEYAVTADSRSFKITIECNATSTADVKYNATEKAVTFKIETFQGYSAFCNVSIPKEFMWVDSLSDWKIKLNETATTFGTPVENQTHTMLYFIVPEGMVNVAILSKYVWPAIITVQEIVKIGNEEFTILFVTNATSVTNVVFNKTKAEITFSTKTHNEKAAFFNVTIPKKLLWVDSIEEWRVMLGDTAAENLEKYENSTHTVLYFECPVGTHQINVIGKYAWSLHAWPSWFMPIVVTVILIVAAIAVIVLFKKFRRKT